MRKCNGHLSNKNVLSNFLKEFLLREESFNLAGRSFQIVGPETLNDLGPNGPSSRNSLPVGLRSSSFGLDTFAKHLKTHLFGLAYSRQSMHFLVCITFCRV